MDNGVYELFAVKHAGLCHVCMPSYQPCLLLFEDKLVTLLIDRRSSIVYHGLSNPTVVIELGVFTRTDDRIHPLQPENPFHHLELHISDLDLLHHFSLIPL